MLTPGASGGLLREYHMMTYTPGFHNSFGSSKHAQYVICLYNANIHVSIMLHDYENVPIYATGIGLFAYVLYLVIEKNADSERLGLYGLLYGVQYIKT